VQLLLDTHAFLWWLGNDAKLGRTARAAIADGANLVFVSAATAWEIGVKRASGRLVAPGDLAGWILENGFVPLPIEVEHAVAAADLPLHHKDPFDRLLVAQAQLENLTLEARDDDIDKYSVSLIDAAA
jgi:PIN domain nuclease of toxin-antitoxin system